MTTVTVERDGAIASVTLPGPALNLAVKEGLLKALRAVAEDDQVRAVVFGGTTADHGNAVRAFLAKEKPAFQGS